MNEECRQFNINHVDDIRREYLIDSIVTTCLKTYGWLKALNATGALTIDHVREYRKNIEDANETLRKKLKKELNLQEGEE
jgi:hypothetical protein